MKKITLFFTAFLILSPHIAVAETISLSTYYPAPFGTYDRIRLVPRPAIPDPCRVGTIYTDETGGNNILRFCAEVGGGPDLGNWGPMVGLWRDDLAGNTFLIDLTSEVGIGTASPDHMLHIKSSGNTNQSFFTIQDSDSQGQLRVTSDAGGDALLTVQNTGGTAMIQLHSDGDFIF